MSEFLENTNGEKSSKRLWGSILIGVGVEMKFVLFHYGLFWTEKAPASPLFDNLDSCANWMITVGSSLLGIGVIELFGKIKNVKKIKKSEIK